MPPKPNEQRREQLLDEIEAIILSEGFEHLRVGPLATRLNCSRTTLYKLAPSKDELVTRIFTRYADRAVADAAARAAKGKTPAEKVMRYSDTIDEHQSKGSDRFWRDVQVHPEVTEALSERRAKGYHYIVQYIEEGIEQGVFRKVNTAWVGHLVWLLAREARDPDLRARLGVSKHEANHMVMDFIVYGLQGTSGR